MSKVITNRFWLLVASLVRHLLLLWYIEYDKVCPKFHHSNTASTYYSHIAKVPPCFRGRICPNRSIPICFCLSSFCVMNKDLVYKLSVFHIFCTMSMHLISSFFPIYWVMLSFIWHFKFRGPYMSTRCNHPFYILSWQFFFSIFTVCGYKLIWIHIFIYM